MRKDRSWLTLTLNPQTVWNLHRLADMDGHPKELGRIVDKLVREKMLSLRRNIHEETTRR